MSKKEKIYAVQKGKNIGIYNTWKECQEQINGFSGAIYKTFNPSEMDLAREYVNGDINVKSKDAKEVYYTILSGHEIGVFDNWDIVRNLISGYPNAKYKSFKDKDIAELAFKTKNLDIMSEILEKEFKDKYDYVVFTDGGSNQDKIGAFAYLILKIENKEIVDLNSFASAFQNVTNNAMEMSAVSAALHHLHSNNIQNKNIGFYIDSKFTIESVQKRYNQTTLKEESEILYSAFDLVSSKNKIDLNHINSHIGLKYNEEVDKLLNLEKEKLYTELENERILNEYMEI